MFQFTSFLQQLKNISIHELKDKIELIVFLDDFLQFDDIGMMQFDEYSDFVEIDAVVPIFVFLFHFFYGY